MKSQQERENILKQDRMKKIKSATEQALETLLGDSILFTVNEVASISKHSKSQIYTMKIAEGEQNLSGGYRIVFKRSKAGKWVCTREELLKFIDWNGYLN